MIKISEQIKKELKKPLGRLVQIQDIIRMNNKGLKIITIGDVCTIELLKHGILPTLAVFDYKTKRTQIDQKDEEILRMSFGKVMKIKNPPGMINKQIIKDARKLIENGGAIQIDGEEDLTALPLILNLENEVLVYGQPNVGMVAVEKDEKLNRKIEKWLK
ncbi:DUF359 domain-containing protein [Candidatus Micrarchaeota archaeon]|nr:DUF359 domain-containing protein [Candidatus Micrarchaeota archaeon]